MVKSRTERNFMDEALVQLQVPDFSKGLMSAHDPWDIPLGAATDCENVRFMPGKILSRQGYLVLDDALPADGDGVFQFYDNSNARRTVYFSNGNLYDVIAGTSTLVKSGAYTAGYEITACVQFGILYFSDGYTIATSGPNQSGIRYYDPTVTVSDAPLLITSGGAGTIETPACKVLISHNGSLVLANIKLVDGTALPDSVMWTNVIDPTSIVGTNIFAVGTGQGGEINSMTRFSVSDSGVSPYDAIFVGKSQFGIYQLRGALSVADLAETQLNVPVGVLDGSTVRYVPGADSKGYVCWLASDRQVWRTDGINSDRLSKDIADELAQAVEDRFTASPSARFRAFRDYSTFHYVLDMGNNTAYAFNWHYEYWTRYTGLPSGCWGEGKTNNTQDTTFCVDTESRLIQLGGNLDNGASISKFWKSGWLAEGDSNQWKIWKWLYAGFKTDTGDINYTVTAGRGIGGAATGTLTPVIASAPSSGGLLWDSGLWDSGLWGAGGAVAQNAYKVRNRLAVTTGPIAESLSGADAQILIEHDSNTYFEVLELALMYLPRGRQRVA